MSPKKVYFEVHKNVMLSCASDQKIRALAAANFSGNYSKALRFLLEHGNGHEAALTERGEIARAVLEAQKNYTDLRKIGVNLNQIAASVNAGQGLRTEALISLLEELRGNLAVVQRAQNELEKQVGWNLDA